MAGKLIDLKGIIFHISNAVSNYFLQPFICPRPPGSSDNSKFVF